MQKNKSEQIIFRAPKGVATLIIAATLNTAPTVTHAQSIARFFFFVAKKLTKNVSFLIFLDIHLLK
jgi:hypothetical protein